MEFRASLIASLAAGVAVASGAFLAVGGRSQASVVEQLAQRLAHVSARAPRGAAAPVGLGLAAVQPLFPVLSGPNAPAEIAVVLQGIVKAPGRTAALLEIGGGSPQWLSLGEVRDGVTLEEITSSGVTIDTARGERQVALGPTDPSPPSAASANEGPPPGYRQPPEPASASAGVK